MMVWLPLAVVFFDLKNKKLLRWLSFHGKALLLKMAKFSWKVDTNNIAVMKNMHLPPE